MDLGWQAGLVLGAAFTIVLDFGLRAILWRLRVRKKKQCGHCSGILGDDGRAEFPVERLECCAWCGDTWPEGKRPEYEAPLPGYREPAYDSEGFSLDPKLRVLEKLTSHLARPPGWRHVPDPLQALVRDLPPAPKKGDLVDLDATFDRLLRPVPGAGKERFGMQVLDTRFAVDGVHLQRKPPPDPPKELPPPRKVSE